MSNSQNMNNTEIQKYIYNGRLRIRVKPKAGKTEIIGWDESAKALKLNIHSKAENNEANLEILKFFSKLLKKKIALIGLKSRDKIIVLEN